MKGVKTGFIQDTYSRGKEISVSTQAWFQIDKEGREGLYSQAAGGDGGWKMTRRKFQG